MNGIPVVAIVCIYIYIRTVLVRLGRRDTFKQILVSKCSRKYIGPVLLISIVAVSLMPIHIINTLFYFEIIHKSEETMLATDYFAILKTCNSILNPFIYASRYFSFLTDFKSKTHSLIISAPPPTPISPRVSYGAGGKNIEQTGVGEKLLHKSESGVGVGAVGKNIEQIGVGEKLLEESESGVGIGAGGRNIEQTESESGKIVTEVEVRSRSRGTLFL